jgi:peptidoglycan lytic transglycosylase D
MRRLGNYLLILTLLTMVSCSSHVRNQTTAEADLPPSGSYSDVSVDLNNEFESSDKDEALDSLDESITDEDAIYNFILAEEYYAFGVSANLKEDWAEAQYNFETAIEILTSIEFEVDSNDAESIVLDQNSRRLMNEITSDYKLTLFNLNVLSDNISPYALDEKFRLLDSLSGFAHDTIEITQTEIEEVTYDMPIVLNDRVKNWIIYFQTSARKFTEQTLARSKLYLPIMERILKEEGVPHDLVYLPFIESGYKDRAYSRVAAVGFWQFMSYTAKDWGLKRNWWYDERLDFEKSTRAAARYLKFLYEEFGDWRLALTAYNGGPGNVNKMIRKNKGKEYWDWKIRNREMRNFVPKYMAAAMIAKQPEHYGFESPYGECLIWDEVKIDRAIYLKDIAKATGVSVRKIKELNPAIRRDYTPPDMKNFTLRLPKGNSSQFYADYKNMKSPKETSWVKHKINRGETVSTIARKYGVSQSAIIQANSMRRPYRIIAGKTIVVPVPLGQSSGYAGTNGRSYELTGNYYIVRPGDYLSNIAKSFGTTPEKLASANNLRNKHRISVGQKLKIPGHSDLSSTSDNYFTHRVKKGETLSKIAKKYGTSINAMCNLNRISTRTILSIGQRLKVPGKKPSVKYSQKDKDLGNYKIHKVRKGQNLTTIANQYGTTVERLCDMNGISNWSTLSIGQQLKVPDGKHAVVQVQKTISPSEVNVDEYLVHKVRRGQNLSLISKKYNCTVNQLCQMNGISKRSTLYVGQQIRVPLSGSSSSDDFVIYVVRRGDTLWDIARVFETSTKDIINLNNHVNPHKLKVGDKLKIRVN